MSDRAAAFANFGLRPGHRSDESDENLDAEDQEESYRAFSLARGVQQFIPMLELRFADGSARAVEYSMLEEVVFDPSTGVTLGFGKLSVIVGGRNLRPLFAAIVRHAVRWIRQADRGAMFELPESATVAESIRVEER